VEHTTGATSCLFATAVTEEFTLSVEIVGTTKQRKRMVTVVAVKAQTFSDKGMSDSRDGRGGKNLYVVPHRATVPPLRAQKLFFKGVYSP
jgi:hypothetical protein